MSTPYGGPGGRAINLAMYENKCPVLSEYHELLNHLTTLNRPHAKMESVIWRISNCFRFIKNPTRADLNLYHQITNLWKFFGEDNGYVIKTIIYGYTVLVSRNRDHSTQVEINSAVHDLFESGKDVLNEDELTKYIGTVYYSYLPTHLVPPKFRYSFEDYYTKSVELTKVYNIPVLAYTNEYTHDKIDVSVLRRELDETKIRYSQFLKRLSLPENPRTYKSIKIYIARDWEDFVLSASMHKTPNNAGGVTFDMAQEIAVFIYYKNDYKIPWNLRHEFLHVLSYVYRFVNNLPTWYVEGVATYLTSNDNDHCYLGMGNLNEAEITKYAANIDKCDYGDTCPYYFGGALTAYLTINNKYALRELLLQNKKPVHVDARQLFNHFQKMKSTCIPQAETPIANIVAEAKKNLYPKILEINCPNGIYAKIHDATLHLLSNGSLELSSHGRAVLTSSVAETVQIYDMIVAEAGKALYGNQFKYNVKTYPATMYCNNEFTLMPKC